MFNKINVVCVKFYYIYNVFEVVFVVNVLL